MKIVFIFVFAFDAFNSKNTVLTKLVNVGSRLLYESYYDIVLSTRQMKRLKLTSSNKLMRDTVSTHLEK